MEPRESRFSDSRKNRWSHWPALGNPASRALRRERAIKCAAAFKAAKQDRRFALPVLGMKLAQAGGHWADIPARWHTPLHEGKSWSRCEEISSMLFALTAAHPAELDPAKIACYPTRADALRGREVVMSPGKFFAACLPDATPKYVQELTEAYIQAQAPIIWHRVKEADSWAEVYAHEHGFRSCMTGWRANDPHHPVRFYAHPDNDLELAYLTLDPSDEMSATTARSIINVKNKSYVRVYGDNRLARALEAAGYVCDADAALEGQKCQAIEAKGGVVVPFLDNRSNISWKRDHCVIDCRGSISGEITSGCSRDEDLRECDHCGDETDEDDIHYSDYHDRHICTYCAERHYTYAIIDRHGNESYVRDDETVTVGSTSYLDDDEILNAHGLVRDEDGDVQASDDCIFLEYLGEFVLLELCVALDLPHGEDNHAKKEDATTNEDGLTVHKEHADA
jgi:hypothetical protein